MLPNEENMKIIVFPLTVETLGVPEVIVIGMQKSTENSDEESDVTCSQIHEFPGDGGHHIKRKYAEEMKELEQYRAADIKRKRRKLKPSEKGSSFKKLCNIHETGRLPDESTYIIGKMTRKILWRNMKYFNEMYKNDCLKITMPRLGVKTEQDKERYSDYVVFHIDKKLTTCRNNAIYALKKVITDGENGGMIC